MQTSPELAMKRLLAAGYPDLFQLCRVWREGERGMRHLPEFTLLEWYRTDADYTALMADCEALMAHLVPTGQLAWQGTTIDLTPPWPRLTVGEAFRRHAACSAEAALAAGRFDEVLALEVEPRLGAGPLFLVDYPAPLAALARLKPGDPTLAERVRVIPRRPGIGQRLFGADRPGRAARPLCRRRGGTLQRRQTVPALAGTLPR